MKAIKNEFPNPVLAIGRDDYVESCRFYTSFNESDITVTTDNIEIPVFYTLNCDGLQKLIDDGKAVVVVNIKSSAASFSRLYKFQSKENAIVIKVPKFSVVKRIDIAGAIIAGESISQFRCPGEFNELYFRNSTFEIRKGDILAREDSRIIYIDDTELEKPISSIFTVNKVPSQAEDVIPDFSGDKIEINLTEPLFNLYYHFRDFNNGSLRRYVSGIIVYPVLVEAIAKIFDYYQDRSGDDCSDKRWFRAIEHKSEQIGIHMDSYVDSYVTLANRLLGNISLEALQSFNDTLESEMNSGETNIIGGVD